ncbi:MAG: SDR family NAD(P)-dependent oxidoreductase [Colwellia sp.]
MVKKSIANNQEAVVSKVDVTNDEQAFNSRLQECPIAIIGMASIFADAKNLEDYWDNIFESVDAIKDVPSDRWAIDDYYSSNPKDADKTYCKRGGFLPEIDFDPMEFGLPPNILELTDIAQLLSLVVAREVLNDAGIGDGSGYDRDKVGITLGVGGGQKQISPLTSRLQGPVLEKVLKASGVDAEDRAMIIEKFKKAYIGWEENSFPGMLGNVISGRIANRFDFGGTNCVVDAACAGSLAAIKLAVSDLLEHRSEVMISGGVCCDNSPFMYMSFSKTPAFTTNEDIRPFDQDSKGMMIGEGIGMMAFKRLEDAERDGDKVYAVLKGIGTSSDGRFKSIYAPRPDGQAKALKRAYDDAGFSPKTCGLIEAHGTGTKAGDAAEFGGLVKHFSRDSDDKQQIALGTVKSQIGHTKAAAGSAGMIKAILALHHKVLPATLHIDQPNPSLDIENSPLYLNSETRPWMIREDGQPRRAGVSSFGFGGTNYHMVLEEYQPTAQGQYRLNSVPQTIVVTAADEQTLISTLTDWQTKLTVDVDAQSYAFNALVTECVLQTPATELARCGFVAKNADEAVSMIIAALKQFNAKAGADEWSVPTGIYFRKSGLATTGKVVALFSGQGSQYVNMGRELACNFPSVMQAAADMDSEFAQAGLGQLTPTTYPIPVFNDDARKAQDEALRLTQHAQPAIGTLSVGLYKTFTNAGFKADFTAGHSFGELTALWAAGVVNDSDYMMLARSRGQAMAAPTGDAAKDFDAGTMIAVVGDPTAIAADIKDIKDISIANYNSNNQVVVAGVTRQIAIAIDELKAKGYKVVPLPVSAAFHTSLVGHAQKPFAQAIDKAKFNKPTIPVFANGTGKAHANKAADIKKVLKNHILESVHFNEEIDNIYAAGGRVFVEFGPKNVLTKLVENILKDKDDVVAIAVNANPKKSADMQLRQAAVQMAVLGLELNDIDPYCAVKRPLAAPKMSPLAMKLTGASYVSPKTKKAFDDALNDGWTIKQAYAAPIAVPEPQVKVVEKIVEVERIVEVEKIVYLNADGTVADSSKVVAPANHNNSSDANGLVSSIERSVSQFVNHQQQLLNVHEQYMQGPKDYAKTFGAVLAAQTTGELPESVDRTLGMYHDFQSETLRVHEQYLNNQTDNMAVMLSSSPTSASETRVVTKAVESTARPVTPTTSTIATETVQPVPRSQPIQAVQARQPLQVTAAAVAMAPVAETVVAVPKTLPDAATSLDLNRIQTVMMEVVAEKTGYPTEMLALEMDMEADLGIDSIKRVEILGSVQEIIADLPELNPEDLAELRTLAEIVDYMQSKAKASAPVNANTLHLVQTDPVANIDLAHIQRVMMEVVAEKTGYPTEMLELEMDMEADLGIDSIKRVEILGAVQETISDLPELNPEDLAELRTLGEIVSYMQSKVAAAPASAPANESALASSAVNVAVTSAPAIDLAYIQSVMMTVVAEKTGYPTEMLELGMDMEADLGIDSIKRVEILGAVQETISDLPELNPEDLAELRTLGEIVTYMQSKVAPTEPTPPGAKTAVPVAEQSNDVTADFQPAPSATVALTALSSVNKIIQDLSQQGTNALANVLVVDDGSGAAVALSGKLIKAGWQVTALKPNWVVSSAKKAFAKAVNVIEIGSSDKTVDETQIKDIIEKNEQLDAVIYLQSTDLKRKNSVNSIEYPESAKQGLMLAFVLAKLCNVKKANKARASFVVVTRQGGTLGYVNEKVKADVNADLVQAGLAGLVKTINHEWNTSDDSVFCRIVDLSAKLSADKAATIINDELLDIDTTTIEVAHDTDNLSNNIGTRLTLTGVATDSYALSAGASIDKKSVFIVSGGAKGVTAHCVIELAKQYQSSFILLGRSSFDDSEPSWAAGISEEVALKKAAMQALIARGDKPTPVKVTQFVRPVLANREIAQTLTAIKAAGGQAQYVAADVTESASVTAAVTSVSKEAGYGKVTGIIHGAGVLADKFIEQKTLAEFNAVYSTKIEGLLSLLAATEQNNIKHLVLFSSAAGFYGNPGQSDYSIANDILNKTAYRFKALNPSAQVLSFNWGPWDGGMVTPELKRMFNDRGVYIIPLDAGAKLLVSELAAKTNRCAQILVGNDLSKDSTKASTKGTAGTEVKKPQVSCLTVSVNKTLLATNNKFLTDHTIGDEQVLPTVCAIAWMRDAAEAVYNGFTYQGLANYKLFKGIIFDGAQASQYNISMDAEVNDANLLVDCKISSINAQGKTVFHYGAQLNLVNESAAKLASSPTVELNVPTRGENAAELYTNGTLFHGESLQGITEILNCDEQGLLLSCQVPDVASSKQGDFPMGISNIFANDLAYQAMLVWVKRELGLGSLPSSTERWTLYRDVNRGEHFYLQLSVVKSSGKGKQRGSLVADIQLIDENKQLLAELKSAKVTASANLNDLFLPKVAKNEASV